MPQIQLMNIKKRLIWAIIHVFLLAILFSALVNSIAVNSTNYQLSSTAVTDGGESLNSTTYANVVGVGVISGVANSTTYVNKVGFLHGIQECDSDSQCSSDNYCCDGLCQSNSCSTTTTTVASSGGTTTGGGGGSS